MRHTLPCDELSTIIPSRKENNCGKFKLKIYRNAKKGELKRKEYNSVHCLDDDKSKNKTKQLISIIFINNKQTSTSRQFHFAP